ncbi:MAG TPA: DUF4230 domain-containing protein [Fluviicola sp.]|nr:DUF4230 domain-containing protein [Fluviicola sp.]
MMKSWVLFLLVFVTACHSEPVEQTEVYKIRYVGKLATTEYTVSKVLKVNDIGDWYKFGDRKILISCRATVKAGIDFNKIKDKDFIIQGKRISIAIPAAEITSFEMKPEDIETEMVEVNGFRSNFSQTEKAEILQKGEEQIRKEIQKLNILDLAEQNARTFLVDFYKNLGFEEVIIHHKTHEKEID